jgi:hypothetical protein
MRSSWGNSFAKQEKKIGYVVNKLRLGDIEALGRCKKDTSPLNLLHD